MPNTWEDFERQVGRLLEQFDYQVIHDTKNQGRQTDVLALSRRHNKTNILIECKHHQRPESRVGVAEVTNFVARVINLRMQGDIDHGYLVTNTGFTSDARAALDNTAVSRFVFLVTYEELRSMLIDADGYLWSYIKQYDRDNRRQRYVELRVVETTLVNVTVFDAEAGLWTTEEAGTRSVGNVGIERRQSKAMDTGKAHDPAGSMVDVDGTPHECMWVLPLEDIEGFVRRGCAVWRAGSTGMGAYINVDGLRRALRQDQRHAKKKDLERKQESERTYVEFCSGLEAAKQSYAEEMLDRLGLPRSKRIITLLASNPPVFPDELLVALKLPYPPVEAKRVWERHRDHTFQKRTSPTRDPVSNLSSVPENTTAVPGSDLLPYIAEDLYRQSLALESLLPSPVSPVSPHVLLIASRHVTASLQSFLDSPEDRLYVLLGDYGAGKSTVLQEFMATLAQRKLSAPSDPTVRVPLLLNLREYNKVANFKALVLTFLTEQGIMRDTNPRVFRQMNEEGYFVLLLDGFDEMLKRVTKADRSRCFHEIAQFIGPKGKVILSGRPGYFPTDAELAEVLRELTPNPDDVQQGHIRHRLNCLQLMDGNELEQFLARSHDATAAKAKQLIDGNPSLYDLARRPVLAAMIIESAKELEEKARGRLTVRDLYETYTNRWIGREEKKGDFRILIDRDKKETFIRFLAMRMHLTGQLSVPYKELGQQIREHFQLDDLDEIDHFNHDIRTCSFLNRSDSGEYKFIHKSFMEFFVAKEFEQMDASPFAQEFNEPLTPEMIAFFECSTEPSISVALGLSRSLKKMFQKVMEDALALKSESIANADYETAAAMRDVVDLTKVLHDRMRFASMRRSDYSHATIAKEIRTILSTNSAIVSKQVPSLVKPLQEALALVAAGDAAH